MTHDSFFNRGRRAAARSHHLALRALVAAVCLLALAACGGSAAMAEAPPSPGAYAGDEAMGGEADMMAEQAPEPPGMPPMAGAAPSPAPMSAAASPGSVKRLGPSAADRAPKGTAQPGKSTGAKEPADAGSKAAATPIAQMLIYTAQLRVLVNPKKYAERIDAVVDIAVAIGGYISRQDNQSVTVRVPSGRFRDALKEMEKLGQVTHREIQAQDVSEEFHDLGIRLKSLKATQQRLQDFLKRAKNIQEVLRIEQELSRLNGEIDRIAGRMRFLSARAAFSTITVSFQPKPKDQIAVDPEDPPPPPPPRSIPLPIGWLSAIGLDQLLQLR
ncbi:MAG: DUF4349 domain-containing protein [Deltaproteobacteria bacterium]|nr:DUF4349 domain-containing protein [Deltaproteobacteria bacterium]